MIDKIIDAKKSAIELKQILIDLLADALPKKDYTDAILGYKNTISKMLHLYENIISYYVSLSDIFDKVENYEPLLKKTDSFIHDVNDLMKEKQELFNRMQNQNLNIEKDISNVQRVAESLTEMRNFIQSLGK